MLRHTNVAGAALTSCPVIQSCLNVSDYCRDPDNDNAVKSAGYPLPEVKSDTDLIWKHMIHKLSSMKFSTQNELDW